MSQPLNQLACLMLISGLNLSAHPQVPQVHVLQASQFHDLRAMERACAALLPGSCTLSINVPQTITLSRDHLLPRTISLRFETTGKWVVDGASLQIDSGVVEAPAAQQVFAGTSAILGLAVARPEWFAAPTALGYPAIALARAYSATVPWGTVLLGDAAYISPFDDPQTPFDTPRRLLGTTRPQLDDEHAPRQLVHGSVIRGGILGLAALQAAHLGVDVGPWVVEHLLHGRKPNGIYLPNAGGYNPRRGTALKDVSVLSNDLDGQHSVLLEGDDGAVVDGLWITSTGGTHGLVLKSSHSIVRDYHCKGATADCLLVKSDYRSNRSGYASEDRFENIAIHYLAKPGDTGGITLDARGDSMSAITFEGVEEDGLAFGIGGAGSWFHTLSGLSVDHWTALQMRGACGVFLRDANTTLTHFICEQTGPSGAYAFYIAGDFTSLRHGEIACSGQTSACAAHTAIGVEDKGSGTFISDLQGRSLGGYLVATMPVASHWSYTGLTVAGSDHRTEIQLHPPRLSIGAWFRRFRADLKPQLRILWSTFITSWARLFHWIGLKLTGTS